MERYRLRNLDWFTSSVFLCVMAAMCTNHLFSTVLFLLLGILSIKLSHGQNLAPVASPFFFLCQYHHDLDQPGGIQGEIALSVSIKGNPEYYEPGKVYEVTVSSSLDFDGFLMTGLYTSPSGAMSKTMNLLNSNLPTEKGGGRGLVCAVVHSHLSHRPSKSLVFLWMAPPAGTGCVNFLATATLGHDVLFKDTLALQLCEGGDLPKSNEVLQMSVVHDSGVIMREDFENGDTADSLIWSEMIGGEISDQCGSILHGKAATFCDASGARALTTVPLNTTTASTLQFALGVGNCSMASDEPPIFVFYGTNKCTKWHELEQIKLLPSIETTVHILCLPPSAKSSDVCIQWYQESASGGSKFKGCWAIDNIIISNAADRPKIIEEKFDPVDPGNFLFFPGGEVKRKCHSEGNALTFSGHGHHKRALVTRDLDMSTVIATADILFNEDFDKQITSWVVKGGEVNQKCEILNYKKSLVLSAKGTRIFCTPYVNAQKAGNLRFHFMFGGDNCNHKQMNVSIGHNSPVLVYAETSTGEQVMLTDVVHAGVMEPTLVSLPIPAEAQNHKTRFCWSQAANSGKDKDVWTVDNILLLPWLPSEITHLMNFKVNFQCGTNLTVNEINVEFSATAGHSWHALHEICLPPLCGGSHSSLISRLSSFDMKGWNKVSYPLPYAALVDGVRFRIKQRGKYVGSNWAIDDLYIGMCPNGCSGHGKCTNSGCQCDMGYSGQKCEYATVTIPSYLSEMFQSSNLKELPSIVKLLGADIGYQCGSLGSGKAVVFDQYGPRKIITKEVNTTNVRFLQFTLGIGSSSKKSPCLTPNHPSEVIYVHYSCNGGLTWEFLEYFENNKYREPKIVSLTLTKEAKQEWCMFQIWQPYHSGRSEDVWAIDDISLSSSLLNVISLNFSDLNAMNSSIRYSSGNVKKYCNSEQEAVVFDEEVYNGMTRSLETKSITVGPSYMVQFNLLMGCGSAFASDKNNQVRLEFSTNHGMNWFPVYKPCLPSNGSCNAVFTKGTVYDATEFSKWKRVTVSLLPATWSSSTRFRFIQHEYDTSDNWALDNLYIGPQCKDMCSGHGRCNDGVCICDPGFYGKSCVPQDKLKNTVMKRFESSDDLVKENFDVSGGAVVPADEGCGPIASGSAVYFYQDGIRQLVTSDIDTKETDFIQFFIRIGGGDPLSCNNASQKDEGVLVQFSNDAGISWSLLKELVPENYRSSRMEHVSLPFTARTHSTRLRWWQPQHSGEGKDQWALDDLYLNADSRPDNMEHMQQVSAPEEQKLLSATTKFTMQRYCNSTQKVLLLNGPEKFKFLITRPLFLREGQVIMFQINVGCSNNFDWESGVFLEYSHDSGVTWHLVEERCYSGSDCEGSAHEASVYFSGFYGKWRRVLVPVTHHLAQKQTLLRWFQGTAYSSSFGHLTPFAINEFYVGFPCPLDCSGHGYCTSKGCECDSGYQGPTCSPIRQNPAGMIDRFDDVSEVSKKWEVFGGQLGTGCGNLSLGNSLYFGKTGYRIAQTTDIDTTNLKSLQFIAQLGSVHNLATCRRPTARSENVFVQYSTTNGLIWGTLRELDYEVFTHKPTAVELVLPKEAKSTTTSFRWWQPIGKKGREQAQWAIDNVQILGNHKNAKGFQDNFNPIIIENWFLTQHGIARAGCAANGRALTFAADHTEEHYAETWDFEIHPSTFLQYDINLGCGYQSNQFHIQLEFSVDKGRTWSLVAPPCMPPDVGCTSYSSGTVHSSDLYSNWTRVTVILPHRAISPSTRFRWIEIMRYSGHAWAIDNVYLGDGCPWMCSGHGYCSGDKCICDPGFKEPHCVPEDPLPCELRDTFDLTSSNSTLWPEVYGGEISARCGVLVSGTALVFYKDGVRMAVTTDLDLTAAQYVQFTLKYGCHGSVPTSVTRGNGILIQYSNNGGITWHLLKELHFSAETAPQYYMIPIKDPAALTNATRIRFWQPINVGTGVMQWAIDDFYVGGMIVKPNVLYDPLDLIPQPDAWLFWPGGSMEDFCTNENRDALVFTSSEGERALYTRDMTVMDDYVIQFEIKVGCGITISPENPVVLQYSSDQGRTWELVKSSWLQYGSGPDAVLQAETPSVYYSNNHHEWQRIVVPLYGLKICGNVRFRWSQGYHSLRDSPSSWAIDNIYIGPSCALHCMGHGFCVNGVMCICDTGYEGDFCHSIIPNPSLLKDSFEDNKIDVKNWELWSGSEISLSCGILISGTSLVFTFHGERVLMTRDLDLTFVGSIQFYLRLGCKSEPPSAEEQPVLLQYSVDGGSTWNMLEQFSFGENSRVSHPSYIAIELPQHARTNATKLRWWQPSFNGTFLEEWALDQVFIGGDANGVSTLNDDFSSTKEANWVLNPGAKLEPTCGSKNNFLHFKGSDDQRYAVTTDVVVGEQTYIQFELVMGCQAASAACYEILLEYSIDMGKTWDLVQQDCLPMNVDCSDFFEGSVFYSDMYQDITRISVPLPYYTRTQTTRFRWIQPLGFKSSQTWAIGHLYIGEECKDMCSGHGKCSSGICKCDDGWTGNSCEESKSRLPTELRDSFSEEPPSNRYSLIVGGVLSDLCGPLASGSAMHFYGVCSRQIVTKDLNLEAATVIHFYFRYGCISPPTNSNHTVFLQFSVNGGIIWKTLKEMYFKNFLSTSYIAVPLHEEARQKAVRIRWWQPHHSGRAHNDWAIDNVFIGGALEAPEKFSAINNNFLVGSEWLTATHINSEAYCNSGIQVAVGKSISNEDAILETTDIHVKKDYVLEFMFSIGCNESWEDPGMPVKLEYSVDFGTSWQEVVKKCLPMELFCSNIAEYPSIYFTPVPWQRFIYPLHGDILSKYTRFRWTQGATLDATPSHKWALRNIYIGPKCPHHCHGHGSCTTSVCVCDKGYFGDSCVRSNDNPVFLKESFNELKLDPTYWKYVVGGKISFPCSVLVEDAALVFSGIGPRIAETVDLDLRDSKFVQFVAQIGGYGDNLACIGASSRNHSAYLQYSINGGIKWHLLHELDYSLYVHPHVDHIILPEHARSSSTRIRWWQPSGFVDEELLPALSMDDIYIGGSEINDYELYDGFESSGPESVSWWFSPYSKVEDNYCRHLSKSLVWRKDSDIEERGITTRELIVEQDFMIQFKIAIACGEYTDSCLTNHSIRLEYTKEPGSDIWELVNKDCFPSNSIHSECGPNEFHTSSVYSTNTHKKWTLVMLYLPEKTYSSATQFRWRQDTPTNIPKPRNLPAWSIDDVYIGEACPSLCHGKGICVGGVCHCDVGYTGNDCLPARSLMTNHFLPTTFLDSFENGLSADLWEIVKGGWISQECGSLAPHGGGKHLYMGECGMREIVTKELDTSLASKLMFVLRIGTVEGFSQCHVNLNHPSSSDKSVILQYSINDGISWEFIALHSAMDFKQPRRLVYEIPEAAKMYGVRFRWWQPFHEGRGYDQWALDNVEIVSTPYDNRRYHNSGIRRQGG